MISTARNSAWRTLGSPALIVVILVVGPWVLGASDVGIGTLCALYLIAGVGLNVLLGYTQQVSFGQGGFWAIGAYSVAILTLKAGVPVVAAVVAAVVITGIASAVIGWPMTQLRGHYIAVATLAFALIVEDVASNLTSFTGGTVGLSDIPPLSVAGHRLVGDDLYRVCWAIALVVLILTANISRSRSGRAFRAVGSDDSGSQALGVPSGAYRLRAFVYAGVLAGVGGAMYSLYIGFVSPDAFGPDLSALILVVLMVGGMQSTYGSVVGAVAVTALTQGLAKVAADPSLPANLGPAVNVLAYGLLIFLVMRFAPRGILPMAQQGVLKLVGRFRSSAAPPPRWSPDSPGPAAEAEPGRDPSEAYHA